MTHPHIPLPNQTHRGIVMIGKLEDNGKSVVYSARVNDEILWNKGSTRAEAVRGLRLRIDRVLKIPLVEL